MAIPPDNKDLIEPRAGKGIVPAWVWFFLLLLIAGMLMQFFMWYWNGTQTAVPQTPFYQVTNRQMSLFLWQNPDFLKRGSNVKGRYLPAFGSEDQVALDHAAADDLVIAPPPVLFRYHAWDRQVRKEFTNTPIPVDEFLKFLAYAKEWLPDNWPDAPEKYVQLIPELPKRQVLDLSKLPYTALPAEVRIAFQGWQNSFAQADQISSVKMTYQQYISFLLKHPYYARNFWRNIVPDYVVSLSQGKVDQQSEIPADEIPPFLRLAYFNNLLQGQQNLNLKIVK